MKFQRGEISEIIDMSNIASIIGSECGYITQDYKVTPDIILYRAASLAFRAFI